MGSEKTQLHVGELVIHHAYIPFFQKNWNIFVYNLDEIHSYWLAGVTHSVRITSLIESLVI